MHTDIGDTVSGPKRSKWFLFLLPYRPTRPTAIPSFHPNISLFHQRHQSSSMPPPMSSVKYILATKSSSLPVVLVDGWWQTLGDSFRTDGSRWSWSGGRHHFTDLLPRYSFLVPLFPFSFFFVAGLYENEKTTSYQTESLSVIFSFPLSATGYGMLPPLRALLACSISMLFLALSPRLQCTLMIRHGGGIRVQTWFRVMSWVKE